ncbi:hypothetical protein DBR32_08375 [Taibaiella sp. KBW10]|uniref:hypothetical protein n=1 Tax=Taibaiella sp. KBW10 TaxID=2153357 RepID=UPI000F5AB887|nr:hypothetical protein [Taibaiella sp. KBW10]RQO30735.1 hypothetical protein DBR32_08375 [Taibaiella sp. KBW10]
MKKNLKPQTLFFEPKKSRKKFKKYFIGLLLSLITCFAFNVDTNAQCPAPTGATVTPTPAACQGQGRVVAKITSPVAGAVYEYQLQYDSTGNTSVVKPWQANDTFTQVPVGRYKVYIQRICSTVISTTYVSASVTVASSTTPLSITQAVQRSKSSCGNGSLSITATGGNTAAPYRYALVPTLTATEPVANYVRPQQSSNIFTGLPAGTYYTRVYDDCGTFASATVVIDSVTESVVLATNRNSYNFYGCDSLSFNYTVTVNNKVTIPVAPDPSERFWITYNGITDTITPTGTYVLSGGNAQISVRKTKVITSYPASITYGYKSTCGNIYQNTVNVVVPNLKIILTNSSLSCTERIYQIRASDSLSGNVYNYYNTRLSLDNGATWSALNTTGSAYTDTFTVGSTQNIWLASNCDTEKIVVNTVIPAINVNLNQFTAYSCNGKSGFSIQALTYSGVQDSIKFNVIAQPAGGNLPDSFYWYQTRNGYNLSYNMVPGTYSIKITDQCGATVTRNLTISPTVLSYTISPLLSCLPSQSGFRLNLSETNYNPYAGYSSLRAIVTNTATNQTDSFLSATSVSRPTTIDVTGLVNGNYTIKVIRVLPGILPYPTCSVDSVYTNTANQPLSLTQSTFTSACSDGTATVAANAQGGGGGYQYSLDVQGSGGSWTAVAGPQTSSIFNNLLPNNIYRLRLTDVCGNGSQYSTSFSNAPRKLAYSSTVAPCPGQSFTMSVSNEPSATYTWHKNSVVISGATTNAYTLNPVPAVAVDTYKVKIVYGTCDQFSASYIVDPASCGQSLPISLESFNGVLNAQQQATLKWKVINFETVRTFDIEYSVDGRLFKKAGTLATNNTPFYNFTDEFRNENMLYYRLKMIGLDGETAYSNVIKLNKKEQGSVNILKVYPTLTSDKLNISYRTASQEQLNWHIVNLKGSILRSGTFMVDAGVSEIMINGLSELADGMYILSVTNGSSLNQNEKFILKK